MILLNTRPKNLSKKINNLCNLEKIELQNIHLSEIISIHINNNSQPYKEIFQNLNKYSNFIFTSQAAVENGARFIKLKSKLLNKNQRFFAVGDSTKEALGIEGYEAIVPKNKSSDGLADMIKDNFPGKNLIFCGENTNMNLQKKLMANSDEIR
jgi:uroporphyrinogen-III synthase